MKARQVRVFADVWRSGDACLPGGQLRNRSCCRATVCGCHLEKLSVSIGCERAQDIRILPTPPIKQFQRFNEALPKRCKSVVNCRRHGAVNASCHKPVRLHIAQSLGEHLLRNSREASLQHAGACTVSQSRMEHVQDHARPFARKNFEYATRSTVLAPLVIRCSCTHGGYLMVSMSHSGAFWQIWRLQTRSFADAKEQT